MSWDEIPEWAKVVASSLLSAVKEKDPYTYGHCRRVARLAGMLAQSAGLSEHDARVIEYASLFHDLGKMGIPDSILLKPGRLNPREEAIMRSHTDRSVDIITPLTKIPFFRKTIPAIRSHHERIDGAGYPDGLSENNIPIGARMIVIADTFDAMTTSRPYRKGLPAEVAYKELVTFAGRQFDPDLVKIFLKAHPHWGEHDEEITEEFVARHFGRAA